MSHRQKNKHKARHRIHANKSTGAAQLPRAKVLIPVVVETVETAPVPVVVASTAE